jgi:uncharacterized integral membrane protein
MRWIYLIIIGLFLAAIIIFAAQNFENVTVSFLGFSASAPLAFLVGIIYVLGVATGGVCWRCCVARCMGRDARRHLRSPNRCFGVPAADPPPEREGVMNG